MKKEIVEVPGFEMPKLPDGKPLVPLSPATKAGSFVYVSGLPPLNPDTGEMVTGDIQVQTRQSLENVKRVLEAAGSSIENVLKVHVYCSNSGYFTQVNEVYREYFDENAPARTFITVGSWMMPFDIEVDCIAIENSE